MLIKGGIRNNPYRQMIKDELGRSFNRILSLSPVSAYLTTKYSPLPLNARLYLRSKMYPYWNFNTNDFRKGELKILHDLALLSSIRQNSWKDGSAYPVERNVYHYPERFDDNKTYRIRELSNEEITGKELKDMAKDYMSTGIAFHDYEALGSMMDEFKDKAGNKTLKRRYSDKHIDQMNNFAMDNKFMRAYHSFTNPIYAVRTGIGRAQLIPYGKTYDKGMRENYIIKDVFDFNKINRDSFPMSKDYYDLHKEAESQSYPIKIRADL